MPSDLIVNIQGNFTGVKMDGSVNAKINALMRRLGGRAKIDVDVRTKASTRALDNLGKRTNAVFKSASAGARNFNKAVLDGSKKGGYTKLIKDSKDLDVLIQALTARQKKFVDATQEDIKAAGGLKAFKRMEAQIDIDIRKAKQLRAEVEKSINVQVKSGVGSARFQELGIAEKQTRAKAAGTRQATAEGKVNQLMAKRDAITKSLLNLRQRINALSEKPLIHTRRTVAEQQELLMLQQRSEALQAKSLQTSKALERSQANKARAIKATETAQKALSAALAEMKANEEKSNSSTRKQIDYREKIRRLMAEEVIRLNKIQQKQAEIAALTGKSFTATPQQDIRREVRQRTTGGAAVSGLDEAAQVQALKNLERQSRQSANAQKELAASYKAASAAGITAETAIRRHGTALQKFGLQARLAIKRYAAYLLPTTGLFAVIGAVRQSVSSFKELEAEQTKLQQVLGGTETSIGDLVAQFQNLATSTGLDVTATTKAARTLAQAGFGREDTGGAAGLVSATEAVSKTQLAATFGNLDEVTDGAIATLRQFSLQLNELEPALDAVNQISKDFAVESKDIFEGIKKGGATFATLGGSVEEFTVLMGLLRDKTRESASSLGTFFKTGGIRLFAAKAEGAIKELDSSVLATNTLPDRLTALSNSFKSLDGSTKAYFASQLVGVRQAARLIAVLDAIQDSGERAEASLSKAAGSLDRDTAKRLDDVATQFGKMRQEINEAVKGFIDADTTRFVISGFTGLVSGIANVFSTLTPVLAPILGIGGVVGGAALIKNIVRPSAKNISLDNNTSAIKENTIALRGNTAAETGSFGSGGSTIASRRADRASRGSAFRENRDRVIRERYMAGRAAGASPATSLFAARQNLPLTARSQTAFALASGFGGARERIGGGISRRFTRFRRNARLTLAGRRPIGTGGALGIGLLGGLAGGALQSSADTSTGLGQAQFGLGGAVQGAAAGATIGSLIPVIGTAFGAASGAAIGLAASLIELNNAEKERLKTLQDEALTKLKSGGGLTIDPATGQPVDLSGRAGVASGTRLTEVGVTSIPSALERARLFRTIDDLNATGGANLEERKDLLREELINAPRSRTIQGRAAPGSEERRRLVSESLDRRFGDLDSLSEVVQIIRAEVNRNDPTAQGARASIINVSRAFGDDLSTDDVQKIATAFSIVAETSEGLVRTFVALEEVIQAQAAKLAAIDIPTNIGLTSAQEQLETEINKVKASFTNADDIQKTFAGTIDPLFAPLISDTASFSEAIKALENETGTIIAGTDRRGIPEVDGNAIGDISRRGNERRIEESAARGGEPLGLNPQGRRNLGADFVNDILDRERSAERIGRSVEGIQRGAAGTTLLQDFFKELPKLEDIQEELFSAGSDAVQGQTRDQLNQQIDVIVANVRKAATDLGKGVQEDFDVLVDALKQGIPLTELQELFTAADPTQVAKDFLGVTQATEGVIGTVNQLLQASNFNAQEALRSVLAINKIEAQQRDLRIDSARRTASFQERQFALELELGGIREAEAKKRLVSDRDFQNANIGLTEILKDASKTGNVLSGTRFAQNFEQQSNLGLQLTSQLTATDALRAVNDSRINLSGGLVASNTIRRLQEASPGLSVGDALNELPSDLRNQLVSALSEVGMSEADFTAPGGFNQAQVTLKALGDNARNTFDAISAGLNENFDIFSGRIERIKNQIQEDLSIVTSVGEQFLRLQGVDERREELTKLQDTQDAARSAIDIINQAGLDGANLNANDIASNQGLLDLAPAIAQAIGQEGIQNILDLAQSNLGGFEFRGTTTTPEELAQILTQAAANIPANAAGLKIGGPGGVPQAADFNNLQAALDYSVSVVEELVRVQNEVASANSQFLEAQKNVIASQTQMLTNAVQSIPDVMKLELNELNIKVDLTGIAQFTSDFQNQFLANINLGSLIDQKIQDALAGQGP